MAQNCNECKGDNLKVTVPYVVHETTVARQERQIKRMWIGIIVLTIAWFLTNMMWLGVFSSYDYSSEEIIVDAEDNGNANYIGQDGNIYNGEDNSAETQED